MEKEMHIRTLALQVAVVAALCTVYTGSALAIPVLFSVGDEKIMKAQDLPDTEFFYNEGTQSHVDVGYCYKQVTIFFLPVWNYDGRWCGYIGKEDVYLDISMDDIKEVVKASGKPELSLTVEAELPIWETVGGKVAVVLVLLVLIGVQMVVRRR
jgi:hypothetical protein